MKRVCFVQARSGSKRLPGKVLADVEGEPLLAHQIRRLMLCQMVDEIVLLTTDSDADDALSTLGARSGVRVIRGSEEDVLGRFVFGALETRADVVVRTTGDCPLIDPWVVDQVVQDLVSHGAQSDYSANVLRRTFPRGLDVEALFSDVLMRIDRFATAADEREHVTLILRQDNRGLFIRRSVEATENNSDLRLTVDEDADLRLIRTLFANLNLAREIAPYQTVVEYLRANPGLVTVNQHITTWTPDA